ncbi:phage GP46 family protein [Acinetobacter ursingii]|uniref:phage GP46 family protein n=1 Tax=Acinetobacter ursingii TaxID=108980 RepID=UPI0021CD1AF5|nr:phage GP46 family protein [Acinetobacter ursingii]MCU4307015.1 phage GP46 family protein [Acinetobacter ursingii]MCU4373230.1 phage GP46 family protein [Acinetobacter ursingii]
MANINLETKDYVLMSLDAAFINDDVQCVCQRLNIHRGKYWADPNLGSRFYLLKRSKDLARNVLLAKQYAEEALFDLVPGRFQSIVVNATQSAKSRVDLAIDVIRLTGDKQTVQYFVAVGG